MAIRKGSERLFHWLRTQKAGMIVPYEVIMEAAKWSEASLKTYITKNKIAPFLEPLTDRQLKVLLNGEEINETFFDETFSQTAPRHIAFSAGKQLEGEKGIYELVERLGNGAVGHVWSASLNDRISLVAVKVMLPRQDLLQRSKLPNVRERFRREGRNGCTLSHPNLVSYVDVGEVERNPFLVMELGQRSIDDQLKASGSIPQEETAEIVSDCLRALGYLHNKSCPHRDIKPANMLEFSGAVKVGDLGIVKWSDFDEAFTKGGTITRQSIQLGSWHYMAPEQQESPHDATNASDIYSLGVSWIEMLTGTLPSPHAIGAQAFDLPLLNGEVNDLVARMCAYRPSERPNLQEISEVIDAAYG